MPVDPDAFAAATEELAAGVAALTTTLRGVEHAITVTSCTWVSREPPLLVVSVHQDARVLEAIEETGVWALSLLPATARATAAWLAAPGRPARGQLDRVPHRAGPATRSPLVDGALVAFECSTVALHPAGDHVLVVGEVAALHEGSPAAPAPPLVRFRRAYRQLG